MALNVLGGTHVVTWHLFLLTDKHSEGKVFHRRRFLVAQGAHQRDILSPSQSKCLDVTRIYFALIRKHFLGVGWSHPSRVSVSRLPHCLKADILDKLVNGLTLTLASSVCGSLSVCLT